MAIFNLPTIVNDPDGQNYNIAVGQDGAQPFARILTDGTNQIVMPDGSRGTQLQSLITGSNVTIYAVDSFPGLWIVKSLTGSWELS